MTKQRLKLAAVLFVLALNGCVSPSIHDGQKAKILPRDSVGWSLQGKAAVTQADKSGSTVNLAWHHSETTRDHIRLSGPLGTGALELLREGEHLFWLDDGIKQPVDLLPMNDEARS
ncbi:MAG: lipoprotein insertase outer membrane protein LolB, partial [Luminiphilus sp.]|nr:lipoprotein insertase outer membrane protein LolB [Luminiphilus sp.]